MDLQKAPLGLLGWLSLKVTGRNPPGFLDSVTPTIEVGDNYLVQSELWSETLLGTWASPATVSSSMNFTVASGKMYRVLALGVDATMDPADVALSVDWYAYVTNIQGTLCYVAGGALTLAGQASKIASYYFPRPLLLPPGCQIRIGLRSSAATTGNATPHAYMLRHQIDV